VSDQTNAWALLGEAVMDFRTRLLLGATALAVIGYFVLAYGGCALLRRTLSLRRDPRRRQAARALISKRGGFAFRAVEPGFPFGYKDLSGLDFLGPNSPLVTGF
jgi:hypothetical protein